MSPGLKVRFKVRFNVRLKLNVRLNSFSIVSSFRICFSACLEMEILFQFGGSSSLLKPSSSAAFPDMVLNQLRKYDPRASIYSSSASASASEVEKCNLYILQRWSKKWEAFVDIEDLSDISDIYSHSAYT